MKLTINKNTSNEENIINTTPYLFIMFILFTALKLSGTINWSWWAVTSPLWIPCLFLMLILLLFAISFLVVWTYEKYRNSY